MTKMKMKRLELGMTQEALGAASGLSRVTISYLECGKTRPSFKHAHLLAEILGLEWWELYATESSSVAVSAD